MKKRRKSRGLKFKLHIAVLIGIICVFGYAIYGNLANIYAVNMQTAEVQARIDNEKELSADIREQIDNIHSDEMIEKIAREKLGYVMPDEIIFIK